MESPPPLTDAESDGDREGGESDNQPSDDEATQVVSSPDNARESGNPLCTYCHESIDENWGELTWDACYKANTLGLGPLHYYCVTKKFEEYAGKRIGEVPATQCMIVRFDEYFT